MSEIFINHIPSFESPIPELSNFQKAAAAILLASIFVSQTPAYDASDELKPAEIVMEASEIAEGPAEYTHNFSKKDLAVVGGLGIGAYLAVDKIGNVFPNIGNIFNGIGNLSFEDEEETIVAKVEGTRVFRTNLSIILTSVSKVSVSASENEANTLWVLPAMGVHKIHMDAFGDVDIAINGTVDIERDDEISNQINVFMSAPQTWRPRIETFNLPPDENGIERLLGMSDTRDRAIQNTFAAASALINDEGCRVINEALIKEGAIIPVVQDILENEDTNGVIGYNPEVDNIVIEFREPTSENEEIKPVEAEEFIEYYNNLNEDDALLKELDRPQLGEGVFIEVLENLDEELSSIEFISGDGESLSVEEIIERQRSCEDNVLKGIAKIEIDYDGSYSYGNSKRVIGQGSYDDTNGTQVETD